MSFLLAACTGTPSIETVTIEDEGVVCWTTDGDLIIDFQECLSSSCDTLLSSSCSASLDEDVLMVTGAAEIESYVDTVCTDDCGFVGATCELPLIEDPATVTVSYGGVDTPMEEVPDCGW